MMIKAIATACLTTVIATSASLASAETGKAGSGPNPFSDCGIGAALFPSTTWAAVISNVIWDIGTTAVTSATASPETCNGKTVQAAQFIIDNYDNLAEETAKGSGEHLTAMLNVLECRADTHGAIISSVRADMADSVAQPAYNEQNLVDKASAYYNSVNSAVVKSASSCSA